MIGFLMFWVGTLQAATTPLKKGLESKTTVEKPTIRDQWGLVRAEDKTVTITDNFGRQKTRKTSITGQTYEIGTTQLVARIRDGMGRVTSDKSVTIDGPDYVNISGGVATAYTAVTVTEVGMVEFDFRDMVRSTSTSKASYDEFGKLLSSSSEVASNIIYSVGTVREVSHERDSYGRLTKVNYTKIDGVDGWPYRGTPVTLIKQYNFLYDNLGFKVGYDEDTDSYDAEGNNTSHSNTHVNNHGKGCQVTAVLWDFDLLVSRTITCGPY